jgi:hypothetical protein
MKIALPGYDARTAPDYDLSFSSNWPMLQVAQTINYTVTTADTTTADPAFSGAPVGAVTLSHNLGFYAFADVWVYSLDSNFGTVVAVRLNSRNGYQIYFGKNTIKLPVSINYSGALGTAGTTYYLPVGTQIAVKVYTFDFTQAFSYSAILPPVGASEYDPHVGIKIVRPGRDIKSKDLRDFIFHSKGSAPQILTVQTVENATRTISGSGTYAEEVITYQIPNKIPARLDFLYSTDAISWIGGPTWGPQVLETSTGLAYYADVYGQYDVQSYGDVSYQMTNTGLFTSFGLGQNVQFSIIVRRDPLLYSAPTVITI